MQGRYMPPHLTTRRRLILPQGCETSGIFPVLPGRRHTTFCMPYCRKCFLGVWEQHPERCQCKDGGTEYQIVCKSCKENEPEELCKLMQAARRIRYQQQARDIAIGK